MSPDGTHNSTPDGTRSQRYTVTEAASVLGISTEATRQRVKRGTLPTIRDDEGNVFVLLEHDGTRRDGGGTSDGTSDGTRRDADGTNDGTALVDRMSAEIEYLRDTIARRDEEIRRRDHLLAAALERIPALESPPETSESPVRASEEASDTPSPPSWWRRFFGLE
jgi:hypothetical protein